MSRVYRYGGVSYEEVSRFMYREIEWVVLFPLQEVLGVTFVVWEDERVKQGLEEGRLVEVVDAETDG